MSKKVCHKGPSIKKLAPTFLIALLAFPEIKKIFTFIFLFKANIIIREVSMSSYSI
jgi:hypothetical protein